MRYQTNPDIQHKQGEGGEGGEEGRGGIYKWTLLNFRVSGYTANICWIQWCIELPEGIPSTFFRKRASINTMWTQSYTSFTQTYCVHLIHFKVPYHCFKLFNNKLGLISLFCWQRLFNVSFLTSADRLCSVFISTQLENVSADLLNLLEGCNPSHTIYVAVMVIQVTFSLIWKHLASLPNKNCSD